MKKAKIYVPTKTAMQSGTNKNIKWILEFETKNTKINPLMGWESSIDTLGEVKLEFPSKDSAINFAEKNNIEIRRYLAWKTVREKMFENCNIYLPFDC